MFILGKKECWKSALQLITSHYSYVRYFSANILYNKVRKDYSQLDDQEKVQLIEVIIQLLVYLLQQLSQYYQINEEKIFIHRIIYMLCHACMGISHGIDKYFNTVLSLLQYHSSCDNIHVHYDLSSMLSTNTINVSQLVLGLHMLIIIPEEVETLSLAHNEVVELKEQISRSIDLYSNIIDQLSHYLLNNNSITLSSSPSSLSLNEHQVKELYLCVLRYTKSWLSYGVTLSKLYIDHR